MKSIQRFVLAAVAVVGLAFAHGSSASASPSTPFSNPGFGLLVTELQTFRSTTYTDAASPQAIAIDKALAYFADESKTYEEDIKDFAKALKVLRPVFTGDAAVGGSIENRVYGFWGGPLVIYLQLAGLLNAAYPVNNFGKLKLVAALDKANKIVNEQKRMKKLASLMHSYQARANKKHVNLYIPL